MTYVFLGLEGATVVWTKFRASHPCNIDAEIPHRKGSLGVPFSDHGKE
jgi:hypothetical protein